MKIFENQSLKPFCTFQIGGNVRYLINWEQTEELPTIMAKVKDLGLPFLVIGGGSNLLFPDDDLNAVVIRCNTKSISHTTESLIVDAGVRWTSLASYMKKNNLFGLEALLSIPGTIGGAIWGNAGCHKQEVKDVLKQVEYFDVRRGALKAKSIFDIDFDYRHSEFSEKRYKIITKAWFKVSQNPQDAHGSLQHYQNFRNEKQPQGLTTGSFFKNTANEAAGALIDSVGLKGFKVGDVSISEKHANFVINHGKGTAKDVTELIKKVQEHVYKEKQVHLTPEVKIIEEKDFTKL